ncbi:MAG TPA: shikimate kinase [Candidatus Acidoferrales bacterium]|nr:shikimate kinase [Candidatus Acidoferrales bacterium]
MIARETSRSISRPIAGNALSPMPTENRQRRLVCLTGFMGSGKSTVARLLSSQLGWLKTDLDKSITEATGASISQIFAAQGEAEFRRIEREQLERVVAEYAETQRPRIVSLGGGTIAQPQNLALLHENGAILIWLQCPIEDLLHRCAQVTDRPLFRDEASFRRLYEERVPAYELSDYRVDGSGEPARVVERILALGIFPQVTV